MTKKHFIALAQTIRESNNDAQAKTFAALVICRVAEQDNPRFDRARFVAACGLEN